MAMELSVFLTYIGAIVLIVVFGKILMWPIKKIFKLLANSLIGAVVILFVNTVGAGFGLMIPLNFINAIIVGLLGLPGAVLLLIMNL